MDLSGTTKLLLIHQEILNLIEINEYCLPGVVVKGLYLSYKKGYEQIGFLRNNNLITILENPPFYAIIKTGI